MMKTWYTFVVHHMVHVFFTPTPNTTISKNGLDKKAQK